MATVVLNGITKSFGQVDVIKGIDLEVEEGAFCVFVGPSGCGKSTLLLDCPYQRSPLTDSLILSAVL